MGAMLLVVVVAGGVLVLVRIEGGARQLPLTTGQRHVHLDGADAAAVDGTGLHAHLGEPQAARQALEAVQRSPGREQRAQKHVAADPGGRVENGKTSIRHRLINMDGSYADGKPSGSR